MEVNTKHPLVSVAVIAYNSGKYILETLESVKAQTYDNIELVISDDCSTDNTIEICQQWTTQNSHRFSNITIIQSPVNTGQSGNYNRAFDACSGEWIKEIDGDDKLLPNCLTDYINYTTENPEAKYIFGRLGYFGSVDLDYKKYEKIFDYNFFLLSGEQQLDFLINNRNCIPSPSSFYSRDYIKSLGFKNDERIPLLEDWPKWIKLLQLGVKFYFLNNEVVLYRVNSGISTPANLSVDFFKSNILFDLLYRYPAWVIADKEKAITRMTEFICEQYRLRIESENEINRLLNTHAYRIGKIILSPFHWIKKALGS